LQLLFEQGGKYLYAIPNATDLIYGFSVDANIGELQPVPGSPFAVTALNISDFSRAIVVPLPASQ